jgi:hypothetical protein
MAGSSPGRCRLALVVARRGRARWLTGVWVFSSYGGWFLMRCAPTGSQWRGEHVYTNLNRWRAATKPGNGEATRPVLVNDEGASGEALAPRMCTKASSSSLLSSRPTICFDRWRKTQIWWLPRVRQVLLLRPKIRTICSAIYRGF